MAIVTELRCPECGKFYEGAINSWASHIQLCNECIPVVRQREKDKFLAGIRSGKTVEERVAAMEEWRYEMEKKFQKIDDELAPLKRYG